MSITVSEMLELPVMDEARLLAGASGLNRKVDGIALLESPDSTRWLTKNSVVLTNTQLLVRYPSLQDDLITALARRQVSGIILKLNRFLHELPSPMLEKADELGIPIISCQPSATSTQLINAISFEVFRSEAHNLGLSYENDFLHDLLIGNEDVHILRNRLSTLGWPMKKTLGVIALKAPGFDFNEEFARICAEAHFDYGFPIQNHFIALSELEKDGKDTDLDEALSIRTSALYKTLEALFPMQTFYIGVGKCYSTMIMLSRSYFEAKNALCFNDTRQTPRPITRFKQMGIFTILVDQNNLNALNKLLDDSVGMLVERDKLNGTEYYKTLQTYYRQDMSVEKTSKLLYVHYNTVRHRLRAIEKLMADSRIEASIQLNLRVLCELYDWREHYHEEFPDE